MDQLIVASRVMAEGTERHLPLTQLQYAGMAVLLFVMMFVLTFCFRSLWHRNDPAAYVPPSGSATGGSSHTGHGYGH